ncbi:hypothetical protein HPB51_011656 [Rhipicephalus microplus]|uniref:Tick transposon n=1 Tax=Rhipicephalus microplus TaxID=6941 RepID=A0A9J6ESM4_RHIMP|nr:hypothetical protein HPB51_011656 [Rhipicephalus microplus]
MEASIEGLQGELRAKREQRIELQIQLGASREREEATASLLEQMKGDLRKERKGRTELEQRSDGKAQAAVTKVKTTTEQVVGIIRRVSNRNRGLKEDDVTCLVRTFAVSRVTYCARYLQLMTVNRDTLNTMLRKAAKQALGVPIYSSTLRLLDMGAHKTMEELIEAHLSNQRIRLSQTEHGQAVLRKIGWQIEPVPIKAALPEDWKTTIQLKPLPRNMTPGKDDKRRTARAKAMTWKLEENPRVMYADA